MNNAPELISVDRMIDIITDIMVLPYSGSRDFTVGTDIIPRLLHDSDGDMGMGLAVLGALSDTAGSICNKNCVTHCFT